MSTEQTKGVTIIAGETIECNDSGRIIEEIITVELIDGNTICKIISDNKMNDANFINEAFTVANETGLTPRQLQKENETLTLELQRVRTDLIEQLRITGNYFDREKGLKEQRDELLKRLTGLDIYIGQLEASNGSLFHALQLAEKLIRGYVPAKSEDYEIIKEALAKVTSKQD